MKKIALLLVIAALLTTGCSKSVDIVKFSGIYPGMSCADLNTYLEKNKMSFEKEENEYEIQLADKGWDEAAIECNKIITVIKFESNEGSTPKEAQAYIDMQTSLLNTFRDQMITYEEGNKIINLNNGVKLHQFSDAKTGTITNFALTIENVDGVKETWKKVLPLLPKVGVKR